MKERHLFAQLTIQSG